MNNLKGNDTLPEILNKIKEDLRSGGGEEKAGKEQRVNES
jgi:hypothetical protein